MRISDWSSDVCSSDLYAPFGRLIPCETVITVDSSSIRTPIVGLITEDVYHAGQLVIPAGTEVHGTAQTDRKRERIDRKSVVSGKGVSVRVDLGGRRSIKKKNRENVKQRQHTKK